jgi:hypothetical protein
VWSVGAVGRCSAYDPNELCGVRIGCASRVAVEVVVAPLLWVCPLVVAGCTLGEVGDVSTHGVMDRGGGGEEEVAMEVHDEDGGTMTVEDTSLVGGAYDG